MKNVSRMQCSSDCHWQENGFSLRTVFSHKNAALSRFPLPEFVMNAHQNIHQAFAIRREGCPGSTPALTHHSKEPA